jgi:DNA end-binding protein Ku
MAEPGRAFWKGSISFGLVTVPVALLRATRSLRSAFHLMHATDHARLRRRLYCPAHEAFVPPDQVRRGYELEDGRHVVVEDEEIEALAPGRSRSIEIQEFVPRSRLGPAWYQRPYYLVPTGPQKPYRLLVEVLAEQDAAGLAEVVLQSRQHLCALESLDGALCLFLLRYPGELRDPGDVRETLQEADAEAEAAQVRAMAKAIESLRADFDPDALEDEYQRRVVRLAERKREQGQTVRVAEPEEDREGRGEAAERGEAVDLMAALEESLEREKAGAS